MDSLTQVVLGGTVAYAVTGKQLGIKAVIYGAILGTIPDLDVFIDFGGPVENFTFHRSFSHSWLVHLLISPLLAWPMYKFHEASKVLFLRWMTMIFLCLSTHALLDSFTVYGTQVFWPVSEYPVGFSSLFIIDPLYTLPLLISFAVLLFPQVPSGRKEKLNNLTLIISCAYLTWSLGAKYFIDIKIEQALTQQDIHTYIYESTPAPFTTFLWRALAVQDGQYFEIYSSVFDSKDEVSIARYDSQPALLVAIEDEWEVQRLKWFTKGLYAVKREDDNVLISDLRMGIEGSYVFTFNAAKFEQGKLTLSDFEQVTRRPKLSNASLLWHRIWDPSVDLSLEARTQSN